MKRIFLAASCNHQKQSDNMYLSRKAFQLWVSVQVFMKPVKIADRIILKVLVDLLG